MILGGVDPPLVGDQAGEDSPTRGDDRGNRGSQEALELCSSGGRPAHNSASRPRSRGAFLELFRPIGYRSDPNRYELRHPQRLALAFAGLRRIGASETSPTG